MLLSFNMPVIGDDAAHNKALADSAALAAKDSYQQGIDNKLANRFEDARIKFGNLAEFPEPGTEQWAGLAADELKYGLPMHEANYWLIKMGAASANNESIEPYLKKAELRLRQVLELNIDKPERIFKAQQMLSQTTITRQAYVNVAQQKHRGSLSGLKIKLKVYFNEHGSWPQKRRLQDDLNNLLAEEGAARNLWLIHEYWQSSAGFYLTLKNSSSGSSIKMKGNDSGGISVQ
jgi:hypothetical protein